MFDCYRPLDERLPWTALCDARRRVSLQNHFYVSVSRESLCRFDLDYPIECDDEYWETPDPKDAFRQPPGKPAKITYFIWAIKLVKILGFAHRTLYATKKSKALIGVIGSEWESQAVAELDSSMNKLKDSIPNFRKTMHLTRILHVLIYDL